MSKKNKHRNEEYDLALNTPEPARTVEDIAQQVKAEVGDGRPMVSGQPARFKIDKASHQFISFLPVGVYAWENGAWVEKHHMKTVAEARSWIEMQNLPEYHA